MEIVYIEAETLKEMQNALNRFSTIVRNIIGNVTIKNNCEWLDAQEVCMILKISPRKLQYLRENDKIPYSKIDRKTFYKKEDILKLIEKK